MNSVEILKPRIYGKRFEDASIPLSLLPDLTAVGKLITDLAGWSYLQEHSTLKTLPANFSRKNELKLTAIEPGSTCPVISLVSNETSLNNMPMPYQEHYEKGAAYLIDILNCAEQNSEQGMPTLLPQKCLRRFSNIGHRLRADEVIEFTAPHNDQKACLTKTADAGY